jgi:hypothetical protein
MITCGRLSRRSADRRGGGRHPSHSARRELRLGFARQFEECGSALARQTMRTPVPQELPLNFGRE